MLPTTLCLSAALVGGGVTIAQIVADLRAAGMLGYVAALVSLLSCACLVWAVLGALEWRRSRTTRKLIRQATALMGPAAVLAVCLLGACGPSMAAPRTAVALAQRENTASLKALAEFSGLHERQIVGSAHDREEADTALLHLRAAVDLAKQELIKAGTAIKAIGETLTPAKLPPPAPVSVGATISVGGAQ